MRMIAAAAFSSAMLFSLFAAADQTPALVAPAGTVASAAPTAAAVADSSSVNLDEVVCRPIAAPTGSRLGGGRECHSVREWNQRERQAQDLTRQQERMGFNAKASGAAP